MCSVQKRCSLPVSQDATCQEAGDGSCALERVPTPSSRQEGWRVNEWTLSALRMPLFHLLVFMDFSNSFLSSFVPRSRIKAVTERLDVYQVGFARSNVPSSYSGF